MMVDKRLRKNQEKEILLGYAEQWSFEPTEWEYSLVRSLEMQTPEMVHRDTNDNLKLLGMIAGECHSNTNFLASSQTKQSVRQIFGWWRHEAFYIFHSVVSIEGSLACVTPQAPGIENPFPFIPDPQIEGRPIDGRWHFFRDGVPLQVGVRRDPEGFRSIMLRLMGRINSGARPSEARRQANQEIEKGLNQPRDDR